MNSRYYETQLINFLESEMEIPTSQIEMILRRRELVEEPLPMLLWQYGLISLNQLEQIFNWLEL